MQFLLLICLMAVCLPLDWPTPRFGMGDVVGAVLTGVTVALTVFSAGAIARHSVGRLERDPIKRGAIGRRHAALRQAHFFAALAAYAICLLVFGWADIAIRHATLTLGGREALVPFGEMLILAPYFVAQVGSWAFFHDVDRAFFLSSSESVDRRFWSRGGYVFFLFRQQLVLVLAPAGLMMTQQAIERVYPELSRSEWMPLASLLILPAFLIIFPLFLPPLLGLRPLPRGPLRDRLEAHARRLRFRHAQIYLWDTRGSVANAMVVGIVPAIRYVVLTDRLLEELTPEEVDGVFGHEVGHARHGHIVFYALFLMLSFVLLGALLQSLRLANAKQLEEYRSALMIAPIAIMGAYMFAVFGFVSRRCERQADLFGCRAGSCESAACSGHEWDTPLAPRGNGLCATGIAHFVNALRRVEEINGMARPALRWRGVGIAGKAHWLVRLLTGWLHTWQHSTIPKRIAFLERVAQDPGIERRFQQRVWLTKCAVVAVLIVGVVALAVWQGWSVLLLAM
jgi:Zn-dependent protease with chaperone function